MFKTAVTLVLKTAVTVVLKDMMHTHTCALLVGIRNKLKCFQKYSYQLSLKDTHYNLLFVRKFVKKIRNMTRYCIKIIFKKYFAIV